MLPARRQWPEGNSRHVAEDARTSRHNFLPQFYLFMAFVFFFFHFFLLPPPPPPPPPRTPPPPPPPFIRSRCERAYVCRSRREGGLKGRGRGRRGRGRLKDGNCWGQDGRGGEGRVGAVGEKTKILGSQNGSLKLCLSLRRGTPP